MNQQRRLIELSYEPIFSWDTGARHFGLESRLRAIVWLYTGRSNRQEQSYASQKPPFLALADILAELDATGAWTGEIHHRTKDGRGVARGEPMGP